MPSPKESATAHDYWDLPEGMRAELIDGELWDLAAPSRAHQRIVYELGRSLGNFIDQQGGTCEVYPAPFAVNLFADETTFVEPDLSVVCDQDKLSDRGCEGAPDLVVEVVSPSSVGMDYLSKLNLYREAGVREYWICDPRKRRTLVYTFGADDEDPLGIFPFETPATSLIFPGFEANLDHFVAGL